MHNPLHMPKYAGDCEMCAGLYEEFDGSNDGGEILARHFPDVKRVDPDA